VTHTDPTEPAADRPAGPGAAATVPELIRAQARRTPERTAVESAGVRLTYARLLADADAVAARLRESGVSRGDLVAVAVPRGVDLIPALLGVQFSGAAYLPLDPEHPIDRLGYIVRDSGAEVVLAGDAGACRGLDVRTRIHLHDIPARSGPAPCEPPRPEDPAYVIYTSGSTGQPKGVVVTHRAFANFTASMLERLGLPADLVLPAVTTISFDIAGLELFLPLTTGGRVLVAGQSEIADPRRLAALLEHCGARAMQATPITWRLLLEAGWSPPRGFTVLCGGERLPGDLAERLLGEDVVLWDLYGPTETTVWSSTTRYERGRPAEFAPVRETTLYVLDERLEPVAAGDAGELYIGGTGLAVGYPGRAGLTAARFVADPFDPDPHARLYRTGDLARRHPDGRIEILGRGDDQIKIRGFRIEPGEIEHRLSGHPEVAEAVVGAFRDGTGADALVGYIRPADPAAAPDPRRLQLYLARSLPASMIPARFVTVDSFPRTANGKLDRSALPGPDATAGAEAEAAGPGGGDRDGAPTSPTERRIAKILAEVLGQQTIGVHEDFFALGGDSLRAVQIILRLNEELETEIPINALFETRTVYGLASLLDAGDLAGAPGAAAPTGAQGARLSAAQWRLWLHQQSAPHSAVGNVPVVVRLPGALDLDALEAALAGLFARHAILRTRYESDGSGLPVPVVLPYRTIRLEPELGDPSTVLAGMLAEPFDLAAAAPVRLRLVRPAEDAQATLLMVVHRMAADDRSLELIAHQLRSVYRGRSVPEPRIGYGDHAAWQRELSTSQAARRHLEFWRTALAGFAGAELRADRPRPAVRDWSAGTVRFTVPPDTARALGELAADRDAPASAALLAGFFALLAERTGSTDLAVGVPVAGRDRPGTEDLVGMLEQTAVVRVDLGGVPDPAESVVQVRNAVLAAAEHAVLPFEDIVAAATETARAEPVPGRNPLFDVFFAVHPIPADPPGFPLPDAPGTGFDLACHLTERADLGFDARIEFAAQLFDASTVAGLAADYVALLERVRPALHETEGPAR